MHQNAYLDYRGHLFSVNISNMHTVSLLLYYKKLRSLFTILQDFSYFPIKQLLYIVRHLLIRDFLFRHQTAAVVVYFQKGMLVIRRYELVLECSLHFLQLREVNDIHFFVCKVNDFYLRLGFHQCFYFFVQLNRPFVVFIVKGMVFIGREYVGITSHRPFIKKRKLEFFGILQKILRARKLPQQPAFEGFEPDFF